MDPIKLKDDEIDDLLSALDVTRQAEPPARIPQVRVPQAREFPKTLDYPWGVFEEPQAARREPALAPAPAPRAAEDFRKAKSAKHSSAPPPSVLSIPPSSTGNLEVVLSTTVHSSRPFSKKAPAKKGRPLFTTACLFFGVFMGVVAGHRSRTDARWSHLGFEQLGVRFAASELKGTTIADSQGPANLSSSVATKTSTAPTNEAPLTPADAKDVTPSTSSSPAASRATPVAHDELTNATAKFSNTAKATKKGAPSRSTAKKS